ncbi:MAG: tetratricopeptide repeat protein [Bacteroidota bacterium]
MQLHQLIEQLKEELKNDRIQQGLDLILNNPELWTDEINESELIHFSGRLSSLRREQTLAIITPERYQAERNQLRMILIEKVELIQKKVAPPPDLNQHSLPEDGDLLLDQASDLYEDGNYQEARTIILQAFGQSFSRYDESEAYAILGNINNELGYLQEAIDAHQKSLEIHPDRAKYWTNLGVVYRLTAQYDKAESCYLKAMELDPDYAPIYTSLGALHLTHTNQYEKAVTFLEKSIELDPSSGVTFSNLAIAKASLGDFEAADQLLRTAVLKGYRNAKNARKMIDNLKAL